jgi:uncharacterized membrane protein
MRPGILTIAAAIAQRRASRMGRKAARKTVVVAAAGYVAVIASLATFGFLLSALWAYIRPMTGPVGTPLVLAAVCLVLALIFLAVIASSLRKPKRARYELGTSETALAVEVQNLISKQKLPILLSVALMGLVAGSQKR